MARWATIGSHIHSHRPKYRHWPLAQARYLLRTGARSMTNDPGYSHCWETSFIEFHSALITLYCFYKFHYFKSTKSILLIKIICRNFSFDTNGTKTQTKNIIIRKITLRFLALLFFLWLYFLILKHIQIYTHIHTNTPTVSSNFFFQTVKKILENWSFCVNLSTVSFLFLRQSLIKWYHIQNFWKLIKLSSLLRI